MSKITIGKCRKNWYNHLHRNVVSGKDVLLDRYRIMHYFKSDSTTTVCLAEQTELEKLFIIKRLLIGSEAEERFYWETQILKHLKHPRIPLLYDIQKDGDYYYIVEEYVDGESLKSVVRRRTLSTSTAIRYAIQLCDILEYLHGHDTGEILYLDCQPDNILLSEDRVFLVDFGNSVYTESFARRNYRYGTVGYAAPELYEKGGRVTASTDVYGVGALLYYMLTGKSPLTDKSLKEEKISLKVKKVIEKCMRHNPRQRYSSIKELSGALQKIILKKADKKNKETTILVISIAGTDRRVGVTHLGMSFAKYLGKKGYYCLFAEQTAPGILMKLLECHKEKKDLRVKEGVFWYKDVGMLPFYGKTIDNEIGKLVEKSNKLPVLIKDYGCFCEENKEDYLKGDVCLLIGGGKPWEFEAFRQKSELLGDERVVSVVNLIGGDEFYGITRQQRQGFIRMPYYSRWWAPGRVGSAFLEQLSGEILKKRKE